MRKIILFIPFILLIFTACVNESRIEEQTPPASIIPEPAAIQIKEGRFEINSNTKVVVEEGNEDAQHVAKRFADKFQKASGIDLSLESGGRQNENYILFTSEGVDTNLNKEGYQLTVNPNHAIISASEGAGLFYGMQSLLALLPPEIQSESVVNNVAWTLPAVDIKDEPRFRWRGLHLDVARHFAPAEFVKKYLDYMAMHKLNTFHWHLTDDQGWRIEIKQYPKLTEVGAWRKETLIGQASEQPQRFDGQRYGGYYTQEEIKDIVNYAAERYITIVPEIEMPGHASAAIAAYPELGVTGEQVDVVTSWGVFPDIFNVREENFEFLENVLTEVMELFPGEYIHIGGDEAKKDQWIASAEIQNKIKELGLKDEHELQSYFITRIEKFLNSKGRQIIGWDEILEGGLAPNATVLSWRGEAGGIAAAKSGHNVVMSPASHMYFDHYQGDPDFEPLAFGGYAPLEKVYSYDPMPDTLSEEEGQYIMGAQANLWSEYLSTTSQVEYMAFPRVSALSEILWSPKEKRDWESFKEKIPLQLERYDARGINYSKSIYKVTYETEYDSLANTLQIRLKNQMGHPDMYYTIDEEFTFENAKKYEGPITIDEEITIQAALLRNGEPYPEITEKTVNPNENTDAQK